MSRFVEVDDGVFVNLDLVFKVKLYEYSYGNENYCYWLFIGPSTEMEVGAGYLEPYAQSRRFPSKELALEWFRNTVLEEGA